MNWKNKIRNLFHCFFCVTTTVTFVTAVYITVFWGPVSLTVDILWQILFVSFLCSLGILQYPNRECRPKTTLLITALHYVQVNIVVLGCGLWFEWFYIDNLPMVSGMLFIIALVFVLVSAAMWSRDRRIAASINEKLKKYQDS